MSLATGIKPAGRFQRMELHSRSGCRPDPWGSLEERIWASELVNVPDATVTPLSIISNEPGTLLLNSLTMGLACPGLGNLQTERAAIPGNVSAFLLFKSTTIISPTNVQVAGSWAPGLQRCKEHLPSFPFGIGSTATASVEASPGVAMTGAMAAAFIPAGFGADRVVLRPPLKHRRKTGTVQTGVASGVNTTISFQAPENGFYALHSLELRVVGPVGGTPLPYDRTGGAFLTGYRPTNYGGGVDLVRGQNPNLANLGVPAMNFHPESRYTYALPAPKQTEGSTFEVDVVHFTGVASNIEVGLWYYPMQQFEEGCETPPKSCGC